MKNILRTLDYYGYDDDSTMYKKNENYKDEAFQISKLKEQQNRKYIKMTKDTNNENDEDNG